MDVLSAKASMKKNKLFRATDNLHFVLPIENEGHFGIIIWYGIINGHLIGPYFYDEILNRRQY